MNLDNLNQYSYCLRCLGRLKPEEHATEPDSSLRQAEQFDGTYTETTVDPADCEFCLGSIEQALETTNRLLEKLQKLEFDTYLVGCSLSDALEKADSKLASISGNYHDLKSEIRREVGLRIGIELAKEVDYQLPDISIVIDTRKNRYDLDIRSLYILGKYKKLTRGLPQTKWPCGNCRGRGCDSCNQTGQQYPKTVETVISPLFLAAAQSYESSFHGAGREDIDALMLGTGRPFVLELKSPSIRNLDLRSLQEEVNQQDDVEITDLRFCDKDMVAFIKQSSPDSSKSYRALVKVDQPVTEEMVKIINREGSEEIELAQRTPARVSHRRADKIRRKMIYGVTAEKVDDDHLELNIDAQGGAYIKEFISSDDGRTEPSISAIIGASVVCLELDVTKVDDRGVFSS